MNSHTTVAGVYRAAAGVTPGRGRRSAPSDTRRAAPGPDRHSGAVARDAVSAGDGTLFAATGSAVARLTPGAGAWSVRRVELPGVHCLAVDPVRDDVVYAGSRGGGLLRSEDGGASWRPLSLPQADVFSVAVSRADGAVYAGCEPSMLFRSDDRGARWRELEALRELPSAPTWSFPPRPWTSHVRAIAPNPDEADRLLVGIELGGLMLSEDGGETWEDHRPGAQRDVHAIAWHPREAGCAYEAGGGGAAWSKDAGRTWDAADEGRDRRYTWALAVDPDDASCWYVSASPGPLQAHRTGQADAYVYRRRGGGPWERLAGGLPQPLDSMPYALAHAGRTLVAGLLDGRIFATDDGGDAWRQMELNGDPLPSILALAPTVPRS
jgi:photosystem II stability/assembly factor-like uncharacterized protein